MMSRPSAFPNQFEPTAPVTSVALINFTNQSQQGPLEPEVMEEISSHQPLELEVDEKSRVFTAFESSLSPKYNPHCSHHSSHTHRKQMSISSLINTQTLSTRTILKIFVVTFLATYLSGLLPPPRIAIFLFRHTLSSSNANPHPNPSVQVLVDHPAAPLPLDFYSRTHSREWLETDSEVQNKDHADDHSIEDDMMVEERPESSRKPFKFPIYSPDPQDLAPMAEVTMSIPINEDFESKMLVIEADEAVEKNEDYEATIQALSHEFDILL